MARRVSSVARYLISEQHQMFAQELQIHRKVSHQSRLYTVLIKVIHVWDMDRHSVLILIRVEPGNERGLAFTTIGEGHAVARDNGGGVQL